MADLHRQLVALLVFAGVSGCSHGANPPRQPEPEVARRTSAPTGPSSASAPSAPSASSTPAASSSMSGASAMGVTGAAGTANVATASGATSTYSAPSTRAAAPAKSASSAKAASSSRPAALEVAKGHLPPPGMCRVWVQGRPAGKQAKARDCAGIDETAPAGSWVLLRPAKNRKIVKVRMVDERRAGIVVRVRVFNAVNGRFLREERV